MVESEEQLQQAVDPAFDRVTLAVVGLAEFRRPTAPGAAFLSVADSVRGNRNGRLDPASAQVGPVAAGAVRLVGPDPVRAPAGAPAS
ncbi:hypothetical protein GCM10010121_063900 [Streptomyces brasiliensis]|uniref:Uncharacterized protein n=1 Tax=Streptomyces brasiliensis TaxID=1954 RepID=A0A917L488_9ACTN|nr:hypothetical protein GCM10010121_063900 [Streptomyces brasiliensis]